MRLFFIFSFVLIGEFVLADKVTDPVQSYEISSEDGTSSAFVHVPIRTNDHGHEVLTKIEETESSQKVIQVLLLESQPGADELFGKLEKRHPRMKFAPIWIKQNVIDAFSGFFSAVKNRFQDGILDKLELPQQLDKDVAKIRSIVSFGLGFAAFINAGLPQHVFIGLLSFSTVRAYFNGRYRASLDNFYAWRGRGGDRGIAKYVEILLRTSESILFNAGLRAMTGPVRDSHSIFTTEGVMEVFTTTLLTGLQYSWANMVRSETFKKDAAASSSISANLFVFTSIMYIAKMAGFHGVEFGFGIALPDVVMPAGILGTVAAMKAAPESVARATELQKYFGQKWVIEPLKAKCFLMVQKLSGRVF